MQASDSVHCSFVLPFYLKSPQIYFVTSLLLARNFLLAFTVQFSRCSLPVLFTQTLQSILGGGYRTRTGDPLLAKQVFYQLN